MIEGPTPQGRAAEAAPQGAALTAARSPHPSSPRGRLRRLVAPLAAGILAIALLGTAACGEESSGAAAREATKIDVFAAASLTAAFTEMADGFTAAHHDVEVALNFAGSNDLATQIQQGAPADVFASADTANMDKVGDLVDTPQTFAGNRLAIAVAPGDPMHVEGLADLSRQDLKVVLAAPDVPAGKYAGEILERAGVSVTPVSLEITVKGVVTKVALGEADTGIVYVTDVTAADGEIDSVEIPDAENVIASYPIATVAAGDDEIEAQAFLDFVLSAEGQKILAKYGFLPPPQ